MNRYLIESNHNKEDCLHVLDAFASYGHITNFEWGCKSGVCTGWAIIEADNETEAMLSVPGIVRDKTRVVKLSIFSPESIQQFHEELEV